MPTDCPTREKHGWMGDALDASEEALWNFGKENCVLLESANEMFSGNETDPRPHQET
jgi:hypothetical protein